MKRYSKNYYKQSELLIHRATGEIRQKNSYGNNPCPPKG